MSFKPKLFARRFEGLSSDVTTLRFSPDSSNLCASFVDMKTVNFEIVHKDKKNLENCSLIKLTTLHHTSLFHYKNMCMDYPPSGTRIAIGTQNQVGSSSWIQLWDVNQNKPNLSHQSDGDSITNYEGVGGIYAVCYSKIDPRHLYSGGSDKILQIWDVEYRKRFSKFKTVEMARRIISVSISEDDELISTGLSNGYVRFYDPRTKKLIRTLKDHKEWVGSVEFGMGGNHLFVSCSDDHSTLFYDMRNLRNGPLFPLHDHSERMRNSHFHPGGRFLLLSGSLKKRFQIFDVWKRKIVFTSATKSKKNRIKGYNSYVSSVRFAPNGNMFAVGTTNSDVHLYGCQELWKGGSVLGVREKEDFEERILFVINRLILANGPTEGGSPVNKKKNVIRISLPNLSEPIFVSEVLLFE